MPELDGLRGLAILLVILFHTALIVPVHLAPLAKLMLFGWSGVDLFFVLSGFLIGGILLDNREADHYFSAFYMRRVFRIVPAYTLIVGCFAICYFVGGDVRSTLGGLLDPPMPWYAYLFTNNFWIARHDTMDVFLAVTWSLAVEEQFYLTLPVAVRLFNRKQISKVVIAVIPAVMLLRSVACMGGFVTQNQAYVLPFFRADALMVGVGCALLVRNERFVGWIKRHLRVLYLSPLLTGAGVLAVGTALPARDQSPATPLMTIGLTVVALFYGSVLMLAVTQSGQWTMATLRSTPLRHVGKLSYFMYLVHHEILVLSFAALASFGWAVTPLSGFATVALGVLTILLLAQLSWTLLESHMMRIGQRYQYANDSPKGPSPQLRVEQGLLALAPATDPAPPHTKAG